MPREELDFRQWFAENEFPMQTDHRFKFLSVFDFDGTIANVPERPTGGDLRSWNGKDWWSSRASLTPPEQGGFFDGGTNPQVVEAMKKAKADPHTRTIVLTGRRSPAAQHVRKVLRDNGLVGRRVIDPAHPTEHDRFQKVIDSGHDHIHPDENKPGAHEEYYTGDHVVTNGISGTFGHKKHVIDKLVQENGGFENIEVWDDRSDHIQLFKVCAEEYLKHGKVGRFTIYQVYPPPQKGAVATIVPSTLQADGTWKTHR